MRKFKDFIPRPPASADSYRVRPTNYIPTSSRGHLRRQTAIALDVQEAQRSLNSNILFRGHLPLQTAIAFDQTSYIPTPVTRPPADADSYRVRQTSYIPTPSRGHLRTQAAIALDVEEAPRSANSNILFRGHLQVQTAIALDQTNSFLHRHAATCAYILFRGHLPVQTAIAFDQQASFLHRHAATCGRRQLSR